jgi:proteic killer suppression protein
MAIKSFKGKFAGPAFAGQMVKGFPNDILRVAQRKLTMVNAAKALDDLKVPPKNQLEKLTKDRAGQHSIRINDKWRVCFRWKDGDAYDVEVTDYH